jgi:hypothetical protein
VKVIEDATEMDCTERGMSDVVMPTAVPAQVKEGLAISKIAQGSPAQLSGELQAMDVIVTINGVDVQGKTPGDAAGLIIGPVGTRVSLTIIRGRGSRRQVEVVRANNLEGPAIAKAASYRYNALVQQQTLLYPWLKRMQLRKTKAVHGGQGTVNEVVFEGAPSPLRIALKVVYQRGSSFKSAERSLWSCPSHFTGLPRERDTRLRHCKEK